MAAMACDQSSLASRSREGEEEGQTQVQAEQTPTAPASAGAPETWPGAVGVALSPMPKRVKQRLDEMRESLEGKRSLRAVSADTIEMRLKEAEYRRQQFHEWMAERARPRLRVRPRDASPGSDREKARQIAAKISAAQQKKSERMAARQRRLAAVNAARTTRNHEASARAEREREELESRVESRFLQAESNRQALLEAERARVALANSRKVQKLERLKKRAEEKLELATRRLEKAEAKRTALIDAERMRASAIFAQARKVAETVVRERERENLERREQIEAKVLKARGRREKILGQRSWSSHFRQSIATRHGDRLSRKLTRCWRQFRPRKTTFELAQAFSTCNLTSMSAAAAALPFETLAERITSAATLKAAKAILGRIESRFLTTSSESPAMSLEPLLRRLAMASAPPPKRRASTPKLAGSSAAAKASGPPASPAPSPRPSTAQSTPTTTPAMTPVPPSPQSVTPAVKGGRCLTYSERYPVRVFLCAYMILGHPDAVFSAKTSREQALAEAAARLLPSFEALLETVLEPGQGMPTPATSCPPSPAPELASQRLPGGDPGKGATASAVAPLEAPAQPRPPFSAQLALFDAAWCEYLEQFVAWKVRDVRHMENEMVRTACKLERSMMRRCGVLPTEDASHLHPDFQLMHKQVLVDQGLLQARIMRIAGPDGVARLASALASLRASFIETRASSGVPQPTTPSSPQPPASSPPTTPTTQPSPRSSSLPHRSLRRRSNAESVSMAVQMSLRGLSLTDKEPTDDEVSGGGTSSEPETPVLSLPQKLTRQRRNSAPAYMVGRADMATPDSHSGKGPVTPPTSPESSSVRPSLIPRLSPMVGRASPFKFTFSSPNKKVTTTTMASSLAVDSAGSIGKRKDPEAVASVAVPEAFDARMLARALTNGTLRLVSSSIPGPSEVPGSPALSTALASISNEKMVYELMHNAEWKLPEADNNSLEASPAVAAESGKGVKETATAGVPVILSVNIKDGQATTIQPISEADFWASLEASLRNQGSSSPSSPSEELTAGAKRVAEIVSRLRDSLIEVAPKMAQEIKESMDCELLEQILASGNVDFEHMGRLLEYAHALMLRLGAPARDEEARESHTDLLRDIGRVPASSDAETVRAAFAHAVVRGVQFVSDRLKVLKIDMANARLSALGPVLHSGAGAQYLRRAFCERFGVAHTGSGGEPEDAARWADILPRTAKWIAKSAKATAEAQEGALAGLALTATQTGATYSSSNSPSLGGTFAAAAAAAAATATSSPGAASAAASPALVTPPPSHQGVPPPSAMRTGRRSVVRSLSFGEPSSSSPAAAAGAAKDSPTDAAGRVPRAPVAWSSVDAVVLAGLVAIVSDPAEDAVAEEVLPETLRLDAERMRTARELFQKIAVITTGMLVARQGLASHGVIGAHAETAIGAVHAGLAKLLLEAPSMAAVRHEDVGALVARTVANVPAVGLPASLSPSASPVSPTPAAASPRPVAAFASPSSGEELIVRLMKKALTGGDAIFVRVAGALSGSLHAAVMVGDPATVDASTLVESFLRKAGAVAMRKEVVDVANLLRSICDVNVQVHGSLYEALR